MRKFIAVMVGLALLPGTVLAVDAIAMSDQPYVVGSSLNKDGEFLRNVKGQTFGSELDARRPSEAPDLISAWATNGKLGYISKAELDKAIAGTGANGTTLSVFNADGTTRVGEFLVPAPERNQVSDATIVRGIDSEEN